MKKNILIPVLCAAVTAAAILSGCAREETGVTDGSGTYVEAQNPETKENEGSDTNPENTENESTDSEPSAESTEAIATGETMEKFRSFLDGKEKVHVSDISAVFNDGDGSTAEAAESGDFTIDEFFKKYFKEQAEVNDQGYYVNSIEYAFTDCGQEKDGTLVLHFISQERGSEYSNLMVIRNKNGQLELCYSASDGYRSENYINRSGILYRGGAVSASAHCGSYYSFDTDKNYELVYFQQNMDPYSLGIGDTSEADKVRDMIIDQYAFEEEKSTDGNDQAAHKEYMKNCYYTWSRTAENGTDESEELYKENSPYYIFMSKISDNLYNPAEMKKILEKRLSEMNVTEEMLKEDRPDWKKLEGHDEILSGMIPPAGNQDTSGTDK